MERTSHGPSDSFSEKYRLYGSMLFKIAMIHLGNKEDAEEAVQEAYIKLLYKAPEFKEHEHEKAWLIRVITNICKNMLGTIWHKRVEKMESLEDYCDNEIDLHLIESVLKLPVKYKAVIHLYYYEDYSVKEISQILKLSESAVKMRLQRGRQLLKFELEGE